MQVIKYNPHHNKEWDDLVRNSKNGTFLFCRDFMEYHSDRFNDHSLLFYDEGELIALLPGNIAGNVFYSHQGLTYGGFIVPKTIKVAQVVALFDVLMDYLRQTGIVKLIYKTIPYIYHKYPSEEDLYMLFRHNGRLHYRNLSCCIALDGRMKYPRIRKRAIARAMNNNLEVMESDVFSDFWKILEDNLKKRYEAAPVHSLDEITQLKAKFPNEIRLFISKNESGTFAGALIFEMKDTVHVQYTSATDTGREIGALDIIYDRLLEHYSEKKYFDFGTSNENNGLYLNDTLIAQKESFGGRGIAYDAYVIDL